MADVEYPLADEQLEAVLELLASDSERDWKILAQNGGGCYLATTVSPVFIPLEEPYCGWEDSELRWKLNKEFFNTLPSSLSNYMTSIVYNHSGSRKLTNEVIILDSEEASRLTGYRPHGLEQYLWDDKYYEWFEYPCAAGFVFAVTGVGFAAKMSMLRWARKRFESEDWADWVVMRDDEALRRGGHGYLFIPNGIHPVICLGMGPRSFGSVDIESFWSEADSVDAEPQLLQSEAPAIIVDKSIFDEDIPF